MSEHPIFHKPLTSSKFKNRQEPFCLLFGLAKSKPPEAEISIQSTKRSITLLVPLDPIKFIVFLEIEIRFGV